MLKVTTKLNATKKEVNVFPCLRRTKSGQIVIFTDLTSGTIIDAGMGVDQIGYHTNSWVRYDETLVWSPLNPGSSITITVE